MVGKKETDFTLRAYKPMRKNNVNQMIIQMNVKLQSGQDLTGTGI